MLAVKGFRVGAWNLKGESVWVAILRSKDIPRFGKYLNLRLEEC